MRKNLGFERDESCKQLVKETREPISPEPGQLERYDYQYERNGVANLFMFFEPLTSWRHVEVTDQDTLKLEIAAWEKERNQKSHSVDWRFTTADARIKLKRLYPSIQT